MKQYEHLHLHRLSLAVLSWMFKVPMFSFIEVIDLLDVDVSENEFPVVGLILPE